MKTCLRCGTQNRDGAVYCDSCGVTLGVEGIWKGDAAHSSQASEEEETSAPSTDREDAGQNWSKTGLDLGGLYKSEVVVGPEGAEVRTESSFLGVRESTSYPRWMITSAAFFFVALLLFFGFVVISAALAADVVEYVALGVGIVGFALLLGYVFYRIYYTPPRRTNEEYDE